MTTNTRSLNDLAPITRIGWLSVGVWLLVFVALVYGSVQIWQMSHFLRGHSAYVHARDEEWKPILEKLQGFLEENQSQNEKIIHNQKVIMERLK